MPVEGDSTRGEAARGLVGDSVQYVINGYLVKYTLAALVLQDEPVMSSEREYACEWLADYVRTEWRINRTRTVLDIPAFVVTEDVAADWLRARWPLWLAGDYVSSAADMVRWVKLAYSDVCMWPQDGTPPF